jgi:putative nucleotidyltransferase with HDIG domain
MKKKVAIQHLTLGMYVVELDRPWRDAPFEMPFHLQGFRLRTMDELERVKALCQYVYIDPQLGKDAVRYLPDDVRDEHFAPDSLPPISPANRIDAAYHEVTTMEEELGAAREVLQDTRHTFSKILTDVQAGSEMDTAQLRQVVGAMVESVIRNPDALTWLTKLKERDRYTYSHSIAVCVLALTFGRHLGLPREDMETLGLATLLQDIGKLEIPAALLDKASALTDAELTVARRHVNHSVELLMQHPNFPKRALKIVASHHERYDGSGYPRGVKGDQISFLSTIAGIVDVYDAMVSDRPQRERMTSFEALSEIYEMRYREFPGAIVEHFIHCVGIFPVGTFVRLNTGDIGVVITRNRVHQLKPKVMLVTDADGNAVEDPPTLDLAQMEPGDESQPWRVSAVVDPRDHGIDPAEFFVA